MGLINRSSPRENIPPSKMSSGLNRLTKICESHSKIVSTFFDHFLYLRVTLAGGFKYAFDWGESVWLPV